MSGAAVQRGVVYLIGLGGTYYEGHTPISASVTSTNEITDHKDARGAIDSHLIQNPGKSMSLTLDIVGTDIADFVPPAKGDIASVLGPQDAAASNWFVRDASVSGSSGHAQLSLSLEKPDSMAEVYGATGTLLAVGSFTAGEGNPSDTSIDLTWVKAASATGYRIFVSTANSKPGAYHAEILDGDAQAFSVFGLTASTTYYFWIETLGGTVPYPSATTSRATTA